MQKNERGPETGYNPCTNKQGADVYLLFRIQTFVFDRSHGSTTLFLDDFLETLLVVFLVSSSYCFFFGQPATTYLFFRKYGIRRRHYCSFSLSVPAVFVLPPPPPPLKKFTKKRGLTKNKMQNVGSISTPVLVRKFRRGS